MNSFGDRSFASFELTELLLRSIYRGSIGVLQT